MRARARVLKFAAILAALLACFARAASAQSAADRHRIWFEEGLARLDRRDYEGAIDAFRRAIAARPDLPEAYYNVACAYALKGEKARAVDWLAESIARGFRDADHIARDPDLDSIRDDPRFCDLMRRTFGRIPGEKPKEAPLPPPPPASAPEPATLFTLAGEPARLDALAGKVVVYFLWRTYALPAREMVPALAELERAYRDRGLAVVAISDEPAPAQEKAADELRANYLHLRREGPLPHPLFEGVDPELIPTVVIVGRDGRVARTLVGTATRQTLERIVLPLLEERERAREPALF